MLNQILQDALFAATAAIGFAAISRPPSRAYISCAVIAAIGHSLRFILMNAEAIHAHIITATMLAAFITGILAVFISPLAKTPAETCLFPALLPMIPGIYAYKAFGGLAMCTFSDGQDTFLYYFFQFGHNAITCVAVLLGMVIGATVPIFLLRKISFQATR